MSHSYDLHCHSTVSDGSLAPEQLVAHAKEQGVDTLALTDHDITAGIVDAELAAAREGLRLIPGVEISVSWLGQTIHILGLGIDPANAELQAGLAGLREFRRQRAEAIAKLLEKKGIKNALAGASAYAEGEIISRTHFARYLLELGLAKDMRDVFKRYLVRGKPGYVAGQWALLEDAVGWIHSAGGQAVVAHPARYKITDSKLRQLLQQFKDHGGVGLEVVSSSHSPDERARMARHCTKFDLLASSGSDYHGPSQPWAQLGRCAALPEGCTPIWETW